MKTVLGLTIFTILGAATLAQTAPPAPDPAKHAQHELKFLTTVLSLSSAQQQQAFTIFGNAAQAESSVHSSMKTARHSLDTAVKNNDAGAIDEAAASIGQLTVQMVGTRAKADAAFYHILTPEQQMKWVQLRSEGPRGFGGGPAVGFGGPPPGLHPE